MDEDLLHQSFAKVVDASFAFTMAFNAFGENSDEVRAASLAYEKAMANYQQQITCPSDVSGHWDSFCALNPDAPECRIYEV